MIAKVSACIIAKNEENNLPRLLESIKGKFDEIVLVDTGSTDKTV
ncbi:glycosyltransferase, partial [Sulfurihydrogenibium yellowstonense]